MKKLIVAVSLLFVSAVLMGTAFEDFVRALGSDLADQVEADSRLEMVLDRTEARQANAQQADPMYAFVRELLYTELSNSQTLHPLNPAKTDPLLKKLGGNQREYHFFDQLGLDVFNSLNTVTDALLEIRITDLDKLVKFELTLTDAKTVSELARVQGEYPADAQTDKLLGKTRPPIKVAAKPLPKPETPPVVVQGKLILSEDFSAYEEGDPLPDWGKILVVVKTTEGKKYVGSQINGKHVLGKELRLPDSFSFSYAFSRVVDNPCLVFYDSEGSEVKVVLARNWNGYWVSISGSVAKHFHCENINQFRITREGATFKVYINGKYMLSGVYEDFKDIAGFRLDLYQGQLYSDFEIKKM